jgi:cytochrome b561
LIRHRNKFQQLQIQTNKILARAHCRKFSARAGASQSRRIAISSTVLHPATIGISLIAMLRWRMTMRELSAEARLHIHARSLSRRTARGFHTAALYGAFVIIAAVVFGTLSIHPF